MNNSHCGFPLMRRILLLLFAIGIATASVYQNTSESPSNLTRAVTFQVSSLTPLTSNIAQRQISVKSVNDAPVLAAIETGQLQLYVGNSAVSVTTAMTVSDVDGVNIKQAKVQITGNYQSGEDILSFTNANGIRGVWTAASGLMTLSGTTTLANYQDALRAIKFQSAIVGTHTITLTAFDGTAWSMPVTWVVSVTLPMFSN